MKSLITSGILAVSLTLSANAAMAASQANPTPNAAQSYRTVRATPFAPGYGAPRIAARGYLPNNRLGMGMDVGQFVDGTLGGLPPQYAQIVRNAVREAASHRSSSGSYASSGSYDFSSPSPTVDVDNSQSQAAIEASEQATQQVDQDTFQMDESLNQ
jgi:hypothetical protein